MSTSVGRACSSNRSKYKCIRAALVSCDSLGSPCCSNTSPVSTLVGRACSSNSSTYKCHHAALVSCGSLGSPCCNSDASPVPCIPGCLLSCGRWCRHPSACVFFRRCFMPRTDHQTPSFDIYKYILEVSVSIGSLRVDIFRICMAYATHPTLPPVLACVRICVCVSHARAPVIVYPPSAHRRGPNPRVERRVVIVPPPPPRVSHPKEAFRRAGRWSSRSRPGRPLRRWRRWRRWYGGGSSSYCGSSCGCDVG